jgi:diacylglycerol kinase family enzyme
VPGVVFLNPTSGPGETTADDLQVVFPGQLIVPCEAAEIPKQVAAALPDGPDFIGVAGGDGTLRCAAEVLLDTGVPFLPVPAGTRNHFAREVGIDDFEAARRAVTSGELRPVDVGEVNGRCFLNNSSLGVYPKLVQLRERHQRRMPKMLAQLLAAWEQARQGHRFDVTVGDDRYRAWLLFAGNGRYGEGLFDLTERDSTDEHVLDLRLVRADRPLARTRVLGALLFGRLHRSPLVVRWSAEEAVFELDRRRAEVSLDGEVEAMQPPLHYRVRPGALTVLVPSEPDGQQLA